MPRAVNLALPFQKLYSYKVFDKLQVLHVYLTKSPAIIIPCVVPTKQESRCTILIFTGQSTRRRPGVATRKNPSQAALKLASSRQEMAGTTVVVFDFDHTIIEDGSDTWVVKELGLTNLFNQLRRTLPWSSLMDRMMEELHSEGKTILEIEDCLRRVPMNPRIIAAITKAYELGCDLRILSDANQFFIETILKQYGLLGCFSEIITNQSFVDDEGRLRILPYHNLVSSPHGCSLCPPNLCKGLVIRQIKASISENGKKRMIYLGDGGGDYCPSLKLEAGDHVMPRKDFPLSKRICSNPALVKAEVHEWSNGEELERSLIQLIDTNLH